MSIEQELISLKEKREYLREKIAEFSSKLEELDAIKIPLEEKFEILKQKTSPLAEKITKEVNKKLEDVVGKIIIFSHEKNEFQKKLEEVEKNISSRENDPSLYIHEQAEIIISEFLNYVSEHSEEIGNEIKKTYSFKDVKELIQDRYSDYHTPTGEVGIYDGITKSFIIKSKNFYFKENLYTIKRDEYDEVICTSTKWYNDYLNEFISVLLKTLKEKYNYSEIFELTIKPNSFTIELL